MPNDDQTDDSDGRANSDGAPSRAAVVRPLSQRKPRVSKPKEPVPPNEAEREIVVLTRGLRFWTRVMGGCAAISVIVALAQCAEMKGQLKAMQDAQSGADSALKAANRLASAAEDEYQAAKSSANATQSLAEAAQGQLHEIHAESRPQITVEGVTIFKPLKITNDGAKLYVTFHLKNVGKSVANYVAVTGEFYARTDNFAVQRQKALCEKFGHRQLGPNGIGYTIVQGAEHDEVNWFAMGTAGMKTWRRAKRPDGLYGAVPMLIGCVDYVFDGTHHQTPFFYEVDALRSGDSDPIPINPFGGDLSIDQVVLEAPFWYNGRVD